MITSVIFLLPVNLMKNKLQLFSLCFKKYRTLLLQWKMHTKKVRCIFETTFTMHLNILNYAQNSLKYKKLYNKIYLNFPLDKVCL